MTLNKRIRGLTISAVGLSALVLANGAAVVAADDLTYPIVDTNQGTCYDTANSSTARLTVKPSTGRTRSTRATFPATPTTATAR